jgi:hypothetical protein
MKYYLVIVLLLLFLSGFSQPLQIQWQHCYGGTQDETGYTVLKINRGYLLFGSTDSNDGDVPSTHGGGDYWVISIDSIGNIIWTKTYGGSEDEIGTDMKPTPDGGFILFGTTFTQNNSGQVSGNHGGGDFWVVKIDSLGTLQWQKCYGGSCIDWAREIDGTKDGGYFCIGYTCSDDGDVTGYHGGYDIWVVRLNQTGDILWEKTFGGTGIDNGASIHQTEDNGAILGGNIGTDNGNINCSFHGGDFDAWVAKIDSSGKIDWQKCYGGSEIESVMKIIPTTSGGYIFSGETNSNDGDVSGNHGLQDFWVVKLDQWGNIQWQKCFGGSETDESLIIKESSDGNYFIGGVTYSNNGDVHGNHSGDSSYDDMWVIKISPQGNLIWQQCLGGEAYDGVSSILEIPDGGLSYLDGPNQVLTPVM